MKWVAANIDWEYSGKPDLNAGTGATSAERALPWVGSLLLLVIAGSRGLQAEPAWTWAQWAVALFLALDVGGGVVANSLNSCKRFYHSPLKQEEKGIFALAKNHMFFVGLHIHTVIAYALWVPERFWVGLAWYLALIGSAVVVLRVPLYLARPIATLLVAAATVLSIADPVLTGLEWLIPLLFLKIVLGHAVREEPVRPTRPHGIALHASP